MSADVHIGELRHRLTLEAPSRVPDAGGGASVTWNVIAAVWARLMPQSGTEHYEHERIAGKMSFEIVIRHRSDVSPDRRFRLGSRVFDIRSTFDPDGRRQWLRCLVEERGL